MKKYIDAEIEIKLLTAEEALLNEESFLETPTDEKTDFENEYGWE